MDKQMQSIDLNLIISNSHEDIRANVGIINSSEVHRVTLTNVFWIRKNMVVLISETMRQRLALDFNRTLPPHGFGPWIDDILPSRDPYKICENVHLSIDPVNYRLKSTACAVLVPDLPVDFVLGTLYFDDFNLIWNSNLRRYMIRSQADEEALIKAIELTINQTEWSLYDDPLTKELKNILQQWTMVG
ncbi:hypothetical protein I4U23_025336 [Adineta vaga]|nr:hypothetical protein I4U23_025336 [Adineta vaga]